MKVLDILSLCIAIATVVYLGVTYGSIPDTIPIHYGIDGKADGFASKSTLWAHCLLLVALTLGSLWLGKYPHLFDFNHPKGKTIEANPVLTLRTKTFISVLMFIMAFIISSSIQISAHSINIIHPAVLLSMILVPIAVVFWGIIYLAMAY